MIAIKENLVEVNISHIILDNETPESILSLMLKNGYVAIVCDKPVNIEHPNLLIHKNKILLKEAFTEIMFKAVKLVVMSSVVCPNNVFKLSNTTAYIVGDDSATLNKCTIERPTYMEGFFGFRCDGVDTFTDINICYPVTFSSIKGQYHLIYNKETSDINIYANLPYRYSLDDYIETLTGLRTIIKPKTIPMYIQLSQSVRKHLEVCN